MTTTTASAARARPSRTWRERAPAERALQLHGLRRSRRRPAPSTIAASADRSATSSRATQARVLAEHGRTRSRTARSSTSAPAPAAPRCCWRAAARRSPASTRRSEMLADRPAARRRRGRRRSRFLVGRRARARLSRSRFDVAVSLRVLMHTPQWQRCLAELCRVADRLVIIDYPSATSVALLAVDGPARRARRSACGPSRIACSPIAQIAEALDAARLPRPLGASPVRAADRLSQGDRIAPLHGRRPRRCSTATGPARAVRLAGHARRRTVRALVTGATGFTGGHLARALAGARRRPCRALVRDAGAAPRRSSAAGIDAGRRRPARSGGARRARPPASTSSITSRRSTGRRACRTTPTARSTRPPCGELIEAAAARRRARASFTAARSASTATSSIRPRTKTRRSSRATSIRSPSSKASGWRAKPARGSASR